VLLATMAALAAAAWSIFGTPRSRTA